MLTEKEFLRGRLIAEYKILDNAISEKDKNIKNKNFIQATINTWIIRIAKEKIYQYQLELEILSEKGRF